VDGLTYGTHGLIVVLFDSINASTSQLPDTISYTNFVYVIVRGGPSAPIVSNATTLIVIPEGTSSITLSFVVGHSNFTSGSYSILGNDTHSSWVNGQWTNGSLVTQALYSLTNATGTISSLPVGSYNVFIFAEDQLDYCDFVNVTVNIVQLNITTSPNISYIATQTGSSLNWTVTDSVSFNLTYVITNNVTSGNTTGSWTSGVPISVNVDNLAAGTYNFTCVVSDGLYGTNSSWAIVTVYSNTPPTITPSTSTYFYVAGMTGNVLSWNLTDSAVTSPVYIIYRNSTYMIGSGSWTSPANISISIDSWPSGYYNVTIVVNNGLNSIAQNQVIVTVDDIPQVSSPTNAINTLSGTTGIVINWTVTDLISSTTNYKVYRNSVLNVTGSWTSGVLIPISIDSPISTGAYNWTIIVSDGLGGTSSNEVDVTVSANPAPTISTTALTYIYLEGTSNGIQWNITDLVTSGTPSYAYYCNQVQNATGTWNNPLLGLSFSVNEWGPGYYNVTLVANNGQGAVSQRQVNVTIVDFPQISQPANLTYYNFVTGNTLSWTVSASINSSTSYNLTKDGVIISSGMWVTGTPITLNVDGLTVGSSTNYTCLQPLLRLQPTFIWSVRPGTSCIGLLLTPRLNWTPNI
jgi:hypothetical protein